MKSLGCNNVYFRHNGKLWRVSVDDFRGRRSKDDEFTVTVAETDGVPPAFKELNVKDAHPALAKVNFFKRIKTPEPEWVKTYVFCTSSTTAGRIASRTSRNMKLSPYNMSAFD